MLSYLVRTILFLAAVSSIPVGFARANLTDDAGLRRKLMSTNMAEGVATMDQATKANIFREVLKRRAAGENVDPALWNDFVSAQNDALRTGPRVGEKVPDFTLPDQSGREHSLQQLMGPKGLLLVFVRSADW
jgi:AhpC/TSA family